MKKIIMLAFVAAIFAGCKDDAVTPTSGGTNNNTGNGVEGTWNLASADQEDGTITVDGELFATFTALSKDEVGGVEFKSDGTFTSTVSYTSVLTMKIFGTPQESEQNIPTTTLTGTYSFDKANNRLTMTPDAGGDQQVATVVELTANSLEYTSTVESSRTEDGSTSVTKLVLRQRLTR